MRVGSRVSRLYCCKTKVPAARISVVRGSDLRGALFAFACKRSSFADNGKRSSGTEREDACPSFTGNRQSCFGPERKWEVVPHTVNFYSQARNSPGFTGVGSLANREYPALTGIKRQPAAEIVITGLGLHGSARSVENRLKIPKRSAGSAPSSIGGYRMFDRTHCTTPLDAFDVNPLRDNMTGSPVLESAARRRTTSRNTNANLTTSEGFSVISTTTFPSCRLAW